MAFFLSVCLNPTLQRTIVFSSLCVGEVNRGKMSRLDASGKGINVCRILSQLGAASKNLTHSGSGSSEFLLLCKKDNLEVVSVPTGSPVRTCVSVIDESDKTTTELIEPSISVEQSTVKAIHKHFKKLLKHSSWVIISGSKTPGYPELFYADLCAICSRAGIPALLDYRGPELFESIKHSPAVVKINMVEFCQTFLPHRKISEASDDEALEEVQSQLEEMSRSGTHYIITRGGRETLMACKGKVRLLPPPRVAHVVNTIGSGDATAAGVAWALSKGCSLEEAVLKGLECGSRNAACLKPGSMTM